MLTSKKLNRVTITVFISCLVFGGAAQAAALQMTVLRNIAELQQHAGTSLDESVQVLGYRVAGDGGGGLFIWNAASKAEPDRCVSFSPTGATAGRWIRQLGVAGLRVENCGAFNNGSNGAATRQAFQDAADYVLHSSMQNGKVTFDGPSYLLDGKSVVVAGKYSCPNFVGGGPATIVHFAPSTPNVPAFAFSGVSGARCGGGITNFTLAGNDNAVGVRLEGVTGATIQLTLGANVRTGVVLCNCGLGRFQ